MINLYEVIKESTAFSKMQVSELLFAEYTCMKEETRLKLKRCPITSPGRLPHTFFNAGF